MYNEMENSEDSKHILLKVLGHDGSEVKFKFLRNAKLSKLMDVYCERTGLGRHEARFIYRNVRILDDDTPFSLKMHNEDTIDVGRIFGNRMFPSIKDELPTSSDNKYINLNVLGHDGSRFEFRVSQNDPFKKLMKQYCNQTNLCKEELRFRYDGDVISEIDTPFSHNMDNGDSIEIFQQQISG